jgi:hypothetical protein
MSYQKAIDNRAHGAQTVIVPREEYDSLRAMASRFEMMRNLFELDFFAPPPTRDVGTVMGGFKKAGKYNKAFLKSIETGLKSSRYFRKK